MSVKTVPEEQQYLQGWLTRYKILQAAESSNVLLAGSAIMKHKKKQKGETAKTRN